MDYYYNGITDSGLNSTMINTSALESVGPFLLILFVVQIVAWWKIFSKAGEQGWKSLIPIYNVVVLYKISGVSPWLLLTCFLTIIPVVGILVILGVVIYQTYNFAKSFGKGIGTTILLLIQPFATITYLVLGLGNSQYVGPAGNPVQSENQNDNNMEV